MSHPLPTTETPEQAAERRSAAWHERGIAVLAFIFGALAMNGLIGISAALSGDLSLAFTPGCLIMDAIAGAIFSLSVLFKSQIESFYRRHC